LNYIRSFECAARHLSFTLAGKELGYTQAAISTHIRALEQYIGRPLFHRRPRGLALTNLGQAFLPTLRPALAQIDGATEAIVTSWGDNRVILGCPMSLAENWVVRHLVGFSAAHPEIELVVHGTVWESPRDPIADLTITLERDDEPPSEGLRLWSERLSLVCAPGVARSIKSPGDLEAVAKILVLGRQEYWSVFAEALGIERLDLDKGLKTNASNIALEMAANGLGFTVSLAHLTGAYVERGLLEEPFALAPPSPWSYYLVSTGLSRGSAAERLRRWLVAAAAPAGT